MQQWYTDSGTTGQPWEAIKGLEKNGLIVLYWPCCHPH